nr:MAG TPA: hypothetical protein [Caudoviricetes sp.]
MVTEGTEKENEKFQKNIITCRLINAIYINGFCLRRQLDNP